MYVYIHRCVRLRAIFGLKKDTATATPSSLRLSSARQTAAVFGWAVGQRLSAKTQNWKKTWDGFWRKFWHGFGSFPA